MAGTFEVSGKSLGRGAREPFEPFSVAVPEQAGTLRDLIETVVLEEVAAFKARQSAGRLISILSPEQINEAASQGRVAMGDRDLNQPVDPDQAIKTAWQAFEDGLYFVFVNDEQIEDLSTPVQIEADDRVMFVRLVALAGG